MDKVLVTIATFVVASLVVNGIIIIGDKMAENYKAGKNVFGKPVKKTAVRDVDGKRMVFMGKNDYVIA